MVKKTITIKIASGLEARPVAMLVQIASQYECKIYVENEGARVNAKSIMGMMSMALLNGEEVVIDAEGEDEEAAAAAIEEFLTK